MAARQGIVRLTFHDLRHTAASLAISAGASPKAVQKMLGHASAAMTLDVYSGLFDQDAEDLGARLSALADRAAQEGQMERSAHHAPTEPVLGGRPSGRSAGCRPPADLRFAVEPPIGIEPMTYSLRVNRSGRLS